MFTMTPYKRPREHDGSVGLDTGPIHGRKKLRPLTLQPARLGSLKSASADPCVTETVARSTLTPVESSDEDDGNIKHGSDDSHSPMDIDSNPDILPSGPRPRPTMTPANSSIQPSPIPHSLIDQSLIISDQHPVTPTYNQIPAAAIGQQCSSVSQPSQNLNYSSSMEALSTTQWCNERLPSPVSDSEDTLTTRLGGASSGVRLSNHAVSLTNSRLCSTPGSKGGPVDVFHPPPPSKPESSNGTGSQSKKKKVSFAMGFRADCDKCRQKVPGHYSHIIRT